MNCSTAGPVNSLQLGLEEVNPIIAVTYSDVYNLNV